MTILPGWPDAKFKKHPMVLETRVLGRLMPGRLMQGKLLPETLAPETTHARL